MKSLPSFVDSIIIARIYTYVNKEFIFYTCLYVFYLTNTYYLYILIITQRSSEIPNDKTAAMLHVHITAVFYCASPLSHIFENINNATP